MTDQSTQGLTRFTLNSCSTLLLCFSLFWTVSYLFNDINDKYNPVTRRPLALSKKLQKESVLPLVHTPQSPMRTLSNRTRSLKVSIIKPRSRYLIGLCWRAFSWCGWNDVWKWRYARGDRHWCGVLDGSAGAQKSQFLFFWRWWPVSRAAYRHYLKACVKWRPS